MTKTGYDVHSRTRARILRASLMSLRKWACSLTPGTLNATKSIAEYMSEVKWVHRMHATARCMRPVDLDALWLYAPTAMTSLSYVSSNLSAFAPTGIATSFTSEMSEGGEPEEGNFTGGVAGVCENCKSRC